MTHFWAWSIGGSAAIVGLGLGGYAVWRARRMAQTHAGTTATAIETTTAFSYAPNRAPQQLPSYVTRRCGTVYVSFGLWPGQTLTAYIAKYVNGLLAAQYPQRESAGSPWFTAGTWSGGVVCASMILPQLQIVSANLQGVS